MKSWNFRKVELDLTKQDLLLMFGIPKVELHLEQAKFLCFWLRVILQSSYQFHESDILMHLRIHNEQIEVLA
jgi:hypothetical protein